MIEQKLKRGRPSHKFLKDNFVVNPRRLFGLDAEEQVVAMWVWYFKQELNQMPTIKTLSDAVNMPIKTTQATLKDLYMNKPHRAVVLKTVNDENISDLVTYDVGAIRLSMTDPVESSIRKK